MMKIKEYNSRAFTLIELVIASTVIGILMLGIMTTITAMQRDSRGFATSYFVNQQTTNVLNHIYMASSLAVGTPSDPGIVGVSDFTTATTGLNSWDVYYNGSLTTDPLNTGVVPKTFCIHQHVDSASSGWPGSVVYDSSGNPTNHRWLCYTAPQGTSGDYNIYWCSRAYVSASSIATACPAAADKVIGKAKEVKTTFSLNSASGSQKASLKVTIISCYDNTQTCDPGNPDNPYYISSRVVFPPGHSA